MFCTVIYICSGVCYFRFAIVKRKCALKAGSYDRISLFIGISYSPSFINNAVQAIHYIIIAIVKPEYGVAFSLPFIIVCYVELYGKCKPSVNWS